MSTRFVVIPRAKGEAVQAPELFCRAWDECIELQVNPKEVWVEDTLAVLTMIDRYEIGVHNGTNTIGGIVLARGQDVHVGDCMKVLAQYVLPEHRCLGVSARCMREAMRLSEELGHTVLSFTHRKGDWRYETIYRRLHGFPKH